MGKLTCGELMNKDLSKDLGKDLGLGLTGHFHLLIGHWDCRSYD